jgi:predicted ABC-type ATPase
MASIIRAKRIRELVIANVNSWLILFTLMMKAIRSSDTSVITRVTRHDIPEDGILHRHRRENSDLTRTLLLTDSFLTYVYYI